MVVNGVVFIVLYLSELAKLSNTFWTTYDFLKVLYLSELAKLSNKVSKHLAHLPVLYLSELAKLSNFGMIVNYLI